MNTVNCQFSLPSAHVEEQMERDRLPILISRLTKHAALVILPTAVLKSDHSERGARTKVNPRSSKLIGQILHLKVGVTAEVVAVAAT